MFIEIPVKLLYYIFSPFSHNIVLCSWFHSGVFMCYNLGHFSMVRVVSEFYRSWQNLFQYISVDLQAALKLSIKASTFLQTKDAQSHTVFKTFKKTHPIISSLIYFITDYYLLTCTGDRESRMQILWPDINNCQCKRTHCFFHALGKHRIFYFQRCKLMTYLCLCTYYLKASP